MANVKGIISRITAAPSKVSKCMRKAAENQFVKPEKLTPDAVKLLDSSAGILNDGLERDLFQALSA